MLGKHARIQVFEHRRQPIREGRRKDHSLHEYARGAAMDVESILDTDRSLRA